MTTIISGIQQIGIGVADVQQAWRWYRQQFGVDIPIFEEAAVAGLMVPYTGGKPRARHALLAINLQGGGGFEVWQFKDREPEKPAFEVQLGDHGIFAARIKCRDVQAACHTFRKRGLAVVAAPQPDPAGQEHFFVQDPYGNFFQVVAGKSWFKHEPSITGGLAGALIGVRDVSRARTLYSGILGYDELVYDQTAVFPDLAPLPGGQRPLRRVLLRHSRPRQGHFSRLLGPSEIELIALPEGTGRKIYENRYWGDLGFIHLCFDITGMAELETACRAAGFPFTINSSQTFDMGEAAGHFAYIEDPDGTLIEFVETHKIPILKKIGWYLNLRNQKPESPLPDWLLKALRFSRVAP
jgi:catechol 2,3-dioxygenase-like lactoylglutathione lyase family enzyme